MMARHDFETFDQLETIKIRLPIHTISSQT